jgi:phosphoglycolate phosphatase
MKSTPTLVLDLDGTLVDTAGDLVATLNQTLANEGLPAAPFESARLSIGHGARMMIEKALKGHNVPATSADLDRLLADFLRHYAVHIADHSRPFPGAEAALDRFAAAGWRLAICTNKSEPLARDLLVRLGLADRFAVIAGPDTFGIRKPDPGHLTETIRAAGGVREAAIMVGDSKTDIDTALAAKIPVVAVTFGYSPEPIAELGADRLIDHYDQLFDAAGALASP